MYSNALQAYEQASKTTNSGREIEAIVLTKAAERLVDCRNNWEREDRDVRLDEALKFNQQIWTIFQTELGKEENPLPKTLKNNMLKLSTFVDKRILESMASPAPEKLTAIIDINRNIAAGLRS